MRTYFPRSLWLTMSFAMVLCAAFRTSGFDDKAKLKDQDNPQSPIEVYEWSIWVGNPAQTTLNTTRVYKNAMPNSVGTSRTKFEEKDLGSKFPVAPVSVVQFFGESRKDVDVDLRAKKGLFLSHWPASTERSGPAPMVRVGVLHESSREHPAELPPGRTLDPETPPERLGALPQARVALRAIHRLRCRGCRPGPGEDPGRTRRVHAAEFDRSEVDRRRGHRAGGIGISRRLARRAADCGPREQRRSRRQERRVATEEGRRPCEEGGGSGEERSEG